MKTLTRAVLTLACAALLAAPAFSQDDKKSDAAQPAAKKKPAADSKPAAKPGQPEKRQRGAAARAGAAERYFRELAQIELTDAQKEQIAALKKQYAPKARELAQKQQRVLTDEQRQSQRKARQDATAAGKKGKELQEAVAAAVGLTEEQKKQQAELQSTQRELQKEIRGKFESLLTDAQKAELPKRGRAAKKADPAQPKKVRKAKSGDQPNTAKPAGSDT
jgi:hypothetical protein